MNATARNRFQRKATHALLCLLTVGPLLFACATAREADRESFLPDTPVKQAGTELRDATVCVTTDYSGDTRGFGNALAEAFQQAGLQVAANSEGPCDFRIVLSSYVFEKDGRLFWTAKLGPTPGSHDNGHTSNSTQGTWAERYDNKHSNESWSGVRSWGNVWDTCGGSGDFLEAHAFATSSYSQTLAAHFVNNLLTCRPLAETQRMLSAEHLRVVDLNAPQPPAPAKKSASEWLAGQGDGFKALLDATAMVDETYLKIAETPAGQLKARKSDIAGSVGATRDAFRKAKTFGSVLECGGLKDVDLGPPLKEDGFDRYDIPIPGRKLTLRLRATANFDPVSISPMLLSSRGKPIVNLGCGSGLRDSSEYMDALLGKLPSADRCNSDPWLQRGCVFYPFVYLADGDRIDIDDIVASIKR